MKTISIKQPWAFLICSGVKDIENRTWQTKFIGRVLVHASASPQKGFYKDFIPAWSSFSEDQKDLIIQGSGIRGAIIGSIEIVDCVVGNESIWAEKASGHYPFPKQIIYNWVLANPILFPEPIPAKGKQSFWDYPNILAEPEEKDGELFCHCQLPVKEQSQVSRFIDHYRCNYCGGKWYK